MDDDERIGTDIGNRLERFCIYDFEIIDPGERRRRDNVPSRGHDRVSRTLSATDQPAPFLERDLENSPPIIRLNIPKLGVPQKRLPRAELLKPVSCVPLACPR